MLQNFKLQYSSLDISTRTQTLAEEINKWIDSKEVMCLCVLKGASFFFCDLIKELKGELDIEFIEASSYKDNCRNEVIFDLRNIKVKDKNILVIDDICDSGSTLLHLRKALVLHKIKSIKTVSLIMRNSDEQLYSPDWFGFEYFGDEWFVGYGMDFYNKYRNLKDIYIVGKDV
jgi:hypoxanthine phosphoribosyltransferase